MKTISAILACSILSAAAGYVVGVKQSNGVPIKSIKAQTEPSTESSKPAEAPAIDAVEYQPIIEAVEPLPPEDSAISQHATRAEQEMQTLTDTRGRTIDAKVLKVVLDQVTIRRSDGVEATFPLSMLSKEDIEFCEYIRDNAPKELKEDEIDWDAIFGDS